MANKQFRSILLYVILHAVTRHYKVDSSLVVAVEGDRIEIECPSNSSYGTDWKFKNATHEYDINADGVVPNNLRKEYSVNNIKNGSYSMSYLAIAQVKTSNAGTYNCLNGENNQHILISVDLALLTIPKCEPDSNSTKTTRRYVCNFTTTGNISSRLEWIKDFCTNSTPIVCRDENEGNIYCEFPINRRNRTLIFLPFATNLTSHSIEACNISCKNWNETSTDDFLTMSLNMSIQISVLLQCTVNPNITPTNRPTNLTTTRTPPRSPGKTGYDFYLIASIVVSITGVLLTLVIVAIFRNTDACSRGRESRDKHTIEERFGEEFVDNSHFYHEAGSGVQTGGGPIYHVLEPSCNGTTPGHPAIALSNTHKKDTAMGNPVYADPDEIRPAPIYEEIPNV